MKNPQVLQVWKRQASRLNARAQHERAVVYFLTLGLIYAVFQFGVFEPLRSYQAALQGRLAANETNLALVQVEAQEKLEQARLDPNLPNRLRLEELSRQLDTTAAPVTALMQSLVSPAEMTTLVKTVLASHHELRVVSIENLPPEDITRRAPSVQEAPAKSGPSLYKHGLRIEVKGGFRDIVEFFDALENLSWKILWDTADIKTERYPVSSATITLYTLSRDEAWLSL